MARVAAAADGGGGPEAGPPRADDDLPAGTTVHLVHFDLSSYGSGRQDYEAVTGGRHVQVHRARSADGLARAWALLAPTTAFRRGDTTYTVKQGHCEKSTGRFADAGASSRRR